MKVLIVDDAENIRYSLRASFEDEGIAVDEAVDGEAALGCLVGFRYDFVVADIWMPRVNGIELLQRMRTISPGTPIIVITGGAARIPMESTAAMARTWGADHVLYKPFDNTDLIDLLRRHHESK